MKAVTGQDRIGLIAVLSIVLAMMSVAATIYQHYVYARNTEVLQHSVSRAEHIRACKEAIEAFFQIKLKIRVIGRSAEREGKATMASDMTMELDVANVVSRLSALLTYLANFQNEDVRYRYTQLSWTLQEIVFLSASTPPGEVDKLFEPADVIFDEMNANCVRTAREQS